MSLHSIYLIILLFWPITEVILLITNRAKGALYEVQDHHSLFILWSTIIVSLMMALCCKKFTFATIPLIYTVEATLVIFLLIVGIVIRWISIITLGSFFTANVSIVSGHRLITTGIYGYIRHPSYTGVLVSFVGISLSFGNWLSFLSCFLPVLFAFLYRINIEEQVLISHFGNIYREYKKQTRSLIPGIY